jgi:pimeloyl-ACP methyl ester carboxylesterase
MKGMAGICHEFARVNGVRLHYVYASANSPRAIFFLHGFPDFWYSWRYQLPYFAKNYHVIAVDQRGYNFSEKPKRVADYALNLLVQDIKNLADHLGLHKFALVGHDWGGAIAWEFANRFPERLSSLTVLNCPPLQVLMAEQFRDGRQLKSSYYIYLFQLPWLPERMLTRNNCAGLIRTLKALNPSFSAEEIVAYQHAFSIPGSVRAGINYYRCAMRQFLPRYLAGDRQPMEIRVPVHVIWGVRDGALQASLTTQFAPLCKNRYRIDYVNAHHFVHQEKPAVVNTLIDKWLRGSIEQNPLDR